MSTAVTYIATTGRHYKTKPGIKRILSREVRAQLYQLHLTAIETRHEIDRLLAANGVSTAERMESHMRRIIRERGQ